MINLIKIKIFNNIIDNIQEDEIASMIEDYGKKRFGNKKNDYLKIIQKKLTGIIVNLNRRIV